MAKPMIQARSQLFLRVKQMLLEQIRSGELKPGQRLPTHKELSRKLGVSEGTISRAVSELTRETILQANRRHGVTVADPHDVKRNGPVAFLTRVAPQPDDQIQQTLVALLQQRLGLQGHEVTAIPALRESGRGSEWLPAE